MIHPARITGAGDGSAREGSAGTGSYVLYWMQAAVRTRENHALAYAISAANQAKKPLIVVFSLTGSWPSPTIRAYRFLVEGIAECSRSLEEMGIRMIVEYGSPVDIIPSYAGDAILLVTDMAYLTVSREWQREVFSRISCPVATVESNLVVPIRSASPKEEWSAATFRRKISGQILEFLAPVEIPGVLVSSLGYAPGAVPLDLPDEALAPLSLDQTVPACTIHGGTAEAESRFREFMANGLERYESARNDPAARAISGLSPYLHFGHISPSWLAREVIAARSPGGHAFLEQLIVRRELAFNYCHYNPHYDRFEGLPAWCKKTLLAHGEDEREYVYSIAEFDQAGTHDPAWNAMQTELKLTGNLHGYLRMYWGKKILEWSRTPEEGYGIAVSLNDRYQCDGRDPNGYTGVAWCFGKHDRPWKEQPVYGMIRYMNDAGLRRKFRLDAYIGRIWILADQIVPEQPSTR